MTRRAAFAFATVVSLAACGDDVPPRPAMARGLIVLGVDGMDPELVDRFIADGVTPNLAALARRGSYIRLQTTNPPQSPVAWSTFITGAPPGTHGIYDFVHRDPRTLSPYLSTSSVSNPDHVVCVGGVPLSLSSPKFELLRHGRAFWLALEAAGIPATLVKVPANFPPPESHLAESLAGMGTPDLLGTYGTFHYFTDDPAWRARPIKGGKLELVDFAGGQRARGVLHGPPYDLCERGRELTLPVEIIVDERQPAAVIRIGDSETVLQQGEWSGWVPLAFDPSLVGGAVHGMVRMYLGSTRPYVHLYVSPINVDPMAPVLPLSSPPRYVTELARDAGRFYTQGMPEDTKALASGALDDDEFLAQADLVFSEEVALLDRELARFHGGFLFYYFSVIDQVSHVFYGGPPIPDLYRRVDAAIGDVLARVGPDVDVIVMSDHGFAPYRRKVHLNTWLARQGYLVTRTPPEPQPLGDIDWSKTRAYALGLNQLFINTQGREAHGVVTAAEREALLAEIERGLLAWTDDDGTPVVTAVARPDGSEFRDRAPDLLVGYNRGYRSSDESALGQVTDDVIVDNMDHWNGDHCIDPALVPGVLLTTRPIARDHASLADLAPTVLAYFGLDALPEMKGEPLWDAPRSRSPNR